MVDDDYLLEVVYYSILYILCINHVFLFVILSMHTKQTIKHIFLVFPQLSQCVIFQNYWITTAVVY